MNTLKNEYFYNCNKKFEGLRELLLADVNKLDRQYQGHLGINVTGVKREIFNSYPDIGNLLDYFNVKKIGIFRFDPNTCYAWHKDDTARSCAINMLLDGTDSKTYFGIRSNDAVQIYSLMHIETVNYELDKFVLLNTNHYHTVFNLDNDRYLLTISMPATTCYQNVKDYLIKNNL